MRYCRIIVKYTVAILLIWSKFWFMVDLGLQSIFVILWKLRVLMRCYWSNKHHHTFIWKSCRPLNYLNYTYSHLDVCCIRFLRSNYSNMDWLQTEMYTRVLVKNKDEKSPILGYTFLHKYLEILNKISPLNPAPIQKFSGIYILIHNVDR